MKKMILIIIMLMIGPVISSAQSVALTRITGGDELFKVDVISEDGANKMLVKSTSVPEALGNLIFLKALNVAQENIAQNCATINQTFTIPAESAGGKDLVIQELRFSSLCGGIKIDKGLCGNQTWTNGLLVRVTSEGVSFDFLPIHQTSHFDNHFSFGPGSRFSIIFASGNDSMTASFSPDSPFILKKGTADKIEILCRDNMTAANSIDLIAFGFKD